jgi:hypothetical protein
MRNFSRAMRQVRTSLEPEDRLLAMATLLALVPCAVIFVRYVFG